MRIEEIRRLILKECLNGQHYGYEINKSLSLKKIVIEIGRLYIILNSMEKEGLVASHWEASIKGPKKKYYNITPYGRSFLDQEILSAIQVIHESYGLYLLRTKLPNTIFNRIVEIISGKTSTGNNIAYYAEDFSPMHEKVISSLYQNIPESTVFLMRPTERTNNTIHEEAIHLRGNYENMPLKDDFIDLLILNGLPTNDKLPLSTIEWSRVLKKNGRVGIIIPRILLHEPDDPMSMTDFIEKIEHQASEKYDFLELMKNLSERFFDIEEKKVLHLSLLVGTKLAYT